MGEKTVTFASIPTLKQDFFTSAFLYCSQSAQHFVGVKSKTSSFLLRRQHRTIHRRWWSSWNFTFAWVKV